MKCGKRNEDSLNLLCVVKLGNFMVNHISIVKSTKKINMFSAIYEHKNEALLWIPQFQFYSILLNFHAMTSYNKYAKLHYIKWQWITFRDTKRMEYFLIILCGILPNQYQRLFVDETILHQKYSSFA